MSTLQNIHHKYDYTRELKIEQRLFFVRMCLTTEQNGTRSADTQREEGFEEESEGFYLHKSPSATVRGYA